MHQKSAPPEPDFHSGDDAVDAKMKAVILRCLQKNPGDRFQNCEELAACLKTGVSAADALNLKLGTAWHNQEVSPEVSKTQMSKIALVLIAVSVIAIAIILLFGAESSQVERIGQTQKSVVSKLSKSSIGHDLESAAELLADEATVTESSSVKQNSRKALAIIDQIVPALDPTGELTFQAYLLKAKAETNLGADSDSIASWRNVIKRCPADCPLTKAEATLNLARALRLAGKVQEAGARASLAAAEYAPLFSAPEFEQTISSFKFGSYLRGEALVEQAECARAERNFEKMLALGRLAIREERKRVNSEENANFCLVVCEALHSEKRDGEAEADLSKWLQLATHEKYDITVFAGFLKLANWAKENNLPKLANNCCDAGISLLKKHKSLQALESTHKLLQLKAELQNSAADSRHSID
jgi:hypothetical protein